MSSVYAPLPFSYLAGGSQAPKTGFRKDKGIYGVNRADLATPIPALRHDQPRGNSDWSVDHMLNGGVLQIPTAAERRRTPSALGDDVNSLVSSYSNVRLPRPDVSLYQSQVDGPRPSSPTDKPSGHYSNRSPVNDDELPTRSRSPHGGGGVFDNFILKGPAAPASQASGTDGGARRTDSERPPHRSHLEELFDDRPSSSSVVAPSRRLDPDVVESRLPRFSQNSDTSVEPAVAAADHARTNSFIVTARSVSR